MEENFGTFFRERIKERGFSLKKLSEVTGIALSHLENMMRGNFDDMPSAPYFHGYLIRIGKALDFDGEEWWMQIKKEGLIKNSGSTDTMPQNRFIRQSPAKFIIAGAIIVLVLIYLMFQLPRIWGKPTLTITSPRENPFTTESSTITLAGFVQNANTLYLNGDEVTIAADGSWQKGVLLQNGVNTLELSAKKLLGGETDAMEQVIYNAPSIPPGLTSSTVPTSTEPISTGTPVQ